MPKPKQAVFLSHDEIIIEAARHFCQGRTAPQIATLMNQKYGLRMTREEPYKLLRLAAAKNWLRLVAPGDEELARRLNQRYRWLQQVDVIPTRNFQDVADHAASMVIQLIKRIAQQQRAGGRTETSVGIGFAGGFSMLNVAQKLVQHLVEPSGLLPDRIIFHALTSGYDLEHPQSSPNAFFSYFLDERIESKIEFVALHAPAIIQAGQISDLLSLPGIAEAYKRVKDVDVILTSAGSAKDEHDMLNKYYSAADREALKHDGCVGDMLWLPLSSAGRIDPSQHARRSVVLVDLVEFPMMIRRGVQVVLALGPCGQCGHMKSDILRTILDLETQLVTHLVVDARTAGQVLQL